MKCAETENSKPNKDIDIPAEIARREQRLTKITEVKAEIERRSEILYEQEKSEYDAKMVERAAKEKARGKKLGGKKPQEPEEGARDKDQVNFTDEDSRIMPQAGAGFVQAYNAQASVDGETMLIVAEHVRQKANDKQEVEPALDPIELGLER